MIDKFCLNCFDVRRFMSLFFNKNLSSSNVIFIIVIRWIETFTRWSHSNQSKYFLYKQNQFDVFSFRRFMILMKSNELSTVTMLRPISTISTSLNGCWFFFLLSFQLIYPFNRSLSHFNSEGKKCAYTQLIKQTNKQTLYCIIVQIPFGIYDTKSWAIQFARRRYCFEANL